MQSAHPLQAEARILLIDDDPIGLKAVERILKWGGYEVLALKSANTALEKIRENPGQFDLVISDVAMPEMDGLTFAGKLRQINDTPLLLLSGRTDTADFFRGINAGANDYIARPVSRNDLLARVAGTIHIRKLRKEIEKNKESAAKQHDDFFKNLHDQIGGRLTDMKLTLDRLLTYRKSTPKKSNRCDRPFSKPSRHSEIDSANSKT